MKVIYYVVWFAITTTFHPQEPSVDPITGEFSNFVPAIATVEQNKIFNAKQFESLEEAQQFYEDNKYNSALKGMKVDSLILEWDYDVIYGIHVDVLESDSNKYVRYPNGTIRLDTISGGIIFGY